MPEKLTFDESCFRNKWKRLEGAYISSEDREIPCANVEGAVSREKIMTSTATKATKLRGANIATDNTAECDTGAK